MTVDSKYKLRQKFIAIRSKIPENYRHQAAHQVADIFSREALFINSKHIACYLPYKDEFDPTPLIELIWRSKKKCYLPILDPEEKMLSFVRYQYGTALQPNRFSILEPIITSGKIALEDLDITITPLLAFDKKGHRLGTGGGYYDRSFAFLQGQHRKKPKMIGLGYAQQEAISLPNAPWDILLDGVITEHGFLDFPR